MKQSSTSVVVMSDAERRERLRNRIYAVFPVVSVLLLILLWFLAAGAENSTFPSPVDIWNRFLLLMEKPIKQLNLFGHIWASLLRVFIALAFAWLLGISFGILIGWNKKANALLGPLFTAFRSVPPLAWVPLMTMWFGTGEFPKILIVFIGALMPVVVNTQAGISNVQNMYLNVGTIFHANKRQMLFEIAIPSALDAIFAGVRTSTSAGWMVVLAAEMLGGKSGIGFLITRGMAEIARLGIAMGGKYQTYTGLSGIGDLIVTCASMHSRNRRAGILIGKGYTMEEAMKEVQMVVEGVYSAKAARSLAKKYNVSMPIVEEVNQVLFEGKPAKEAVADLMLRDKRIEHSDLPWE